MSSGDTDQFKIRPLKVSGAEIADDALSSSHFSAESISSEHFAASLVTKAKLQTSGFAGTGLVQNVDGSLTLSTSLGAAYIQANSVTTGGILDGSLTAAKFDFTSGFTIAALSTTGTLTLTGSVVVGASPCVFQGTTNNGYTTTWAFVDPTSDWTVVWPTAAGIVVLTGLANSVTSSMITDVTITDNDIASNAVESAQIVDGTIATADFAANSVTLAKLADNAVTTTELAAGAITTPDLGTSLSIAGLTVTGTLTVSSATIAGATPLVFVGALGNTLSFAVALTGNQVATFQDLTGTVILSGVGTDVVDTGMITDNTVLSADFNTNSITTTEIVDGTISDSDFSNGIVTTTYLATDSVSTTKFAAATIATADIDSSSGVTIASLTVSAKFDSSSVQVKGASPFIFRPASGYRTTFAFTDPTLARTITWPNLSGGVVLGGLADSITTTSLSSGVVTMAKMAADSVNSAVISDGGIAEADLAANAVAAAELTSGAVSTDDLGADAVTNVKVAADIAGTGLTQLGSGAIALDTAGVAPSNLAADSVTMVKIAADVAGTGIQQDSDGSLKISTVSNSGIELNSGQLRLQDAYVVNSYLSTNAVATANIRDINVVASKLASGSVTAAKISTISGTGLAHNGGTNALDIQASAVASTHIAANVISTADFTTSGISITALTVGSTADFSASEIMGSSPLKFYGTQSTYTIDLSFPTLTSSTKTYTFPDATGTMIITGGTNTVSSTMITDRAVSLADMNANSVNSAKIVDLSLVASDFASDAITATELASDSVTSNKIVAGTIVASDIASGVTITALATAGTLGLSSATIQNASPLHFTGASGSYSLTFAISTMNTAARTVIFPDLTGTLMVTGSTDSVTSTSILDSTVSVADMGDNSVNSAKIINHEIATADFANSAVGTLDIVDNAVSSSHINAGEIGTNHFTLGGITVTLLTTLGDLTLSGADILSGSPMKFQGSADDANTLTWTLTNPASSSNTITFDNLAGEIILTGSSQKVSSAMITDSTITSSDFSSQCVTSAKINDGTIATVDFADAGIDGTMIPDSNIASTELADGGVATADFEANSVTNVKVAANAATSVKIQNAAVTTAKLASSIEIGNLKLAVGSTDNTGVSCDVSLRGQFYYYGDDTGVNSYRDKLLICRCGGSPGCQWEYMIFWGA
eukprot:959856_1